MSEPDELYNLRNNYWIGNYQKAISEGSALQRLSEEKKIESKEYIYRSYIALGQCGVVLDEVKDEPTTPISLKAVRLLARYLTLPHEKEQVISTMEGWLAGVTEGNTATLQLMAAMIFLHEDNTKEALRCVHLGATMEHLALTVQIFLKMDRPDLALKTVKVMQQADEDATLTQIALAWTHLASGGSKLQEAAYIYDELADKHEGTVMLRNGAAVANIHMGKFDEAERCLLDAITKGQNDPDTLVNLICCYQHMNKPADLVNRYISQLKTVAPRHPFVASLGTVESAFSRVSETYMAGIEK